MPFFEEITTGGRKAAAPGFGESAARGAAAAHWRS
jgi:hypothetical protein